MKKILPLKNVISMTAQSDSTLCAILCTNSKTYSWIMNNYIFFWQRTSLMFPDCKTISLMPLVNSLNIGKECPYISQKVFNRDEIFTLSKNFADFTKEQINNNNYVIAKMDQFYVNGTKQHLDHNNLIYGYDTEQNVFYIQDHFIKGKLSTIALPYKSFCQAFQRKNNFMDVQESAACIAGLCDEKTLNNIYKKIGPNSSEFKNNLLYSLSDTLNSLPIHTGQRKTEVQFPCSKDGSYGIGVYLGLKKYLDNSSAKIDFRDFTTLKSINELMVKRIDYLYSNNYIDDTQIKNIFLQLCENCNACINLAIKFNLTYKNSLKNTIALKLEEMYHIANEGYKALLLQLSPSPKAVDFIYLEQMYK